MKLENMAIIFLLLIVPISMILETYTQTRIETISLQSQYDAKLNNSTYDALKAYQLNSFSNSEYALSNSKMRDIKASVNSFFTSLSNNFSSIGYTRDLLEAYVPAIVYTMYDGYYIYAPYKNTWDLKADKSSNVSQAEWKIEGEDTVGVPDQKSGTYTENKDLYGLRPYIYYSARYTDDVNNDVVITYSLDNYISIIGKLNGKYFNKSGYLLSQVTQNSYKDITIYKESVPEENVLVAGKICKYPCIRLKGTKYYMANNDSLVDENIKNGDVFYVSNGKVNVQKNGEGYDAFYDSDGNAKNEDDRALKYYQAAKDMENFIECKDNGGQGTFLKNLTINDLVDNSGNKYVNSSQSFKDSFTIFNGKIFDFDHSTGIEADDSNFNTHRIDVIKYTIESNLSVAVANYNQYSSAGGSTNFQIPKLKDTDWDKLTNNIGIITFLQGIGIGGKIYNGYSVVANTKNSDVVSEDSLYIWTKNDNKIHNVAETNDGENSSLNLDNARGIFNVDCERRTINSVMAIGDGNNTNSYYPINASYSYESVVTQDKVGNRKKILKNNKSLAKLYYTALGRERYSLYRTQ